MSSAATLCKLTITPFALVLAALSLIASYFIGVPWTKEVAVAETKIDGSFSPDANIQEIAEAYALDAVDAAKMHFGIELDWSDESIAKVEGVLASLHASYLSTNPKPTEEKVSNYAKAFGSYIGEVFRRNHGAQWGIVTLGGQKMPGLQASSGTRFWPWVKAFGRITKGDEDNVASYYKFLLESLQGKAERND